MKRSLFWMMLTCCASAWAQLVVSNTRTLAFGSFAAASGGTVTLAPSGARSRTGGVVLVAAGGAATSAAFSVSDTDPANASRTYLITLPDDGAVTLGSGASTMAVNGFTSNPSTFGALSGGSQILTVGATLTVGANQPAGTYSGNFSVIVNFE
jgi:hypothetical protein